MLVVIALAVAARLVAIFASFPHIHWADESYKVFEPAHRMAFGYGLVVWEFRDGIVSPVLPALLAALWLLVEPVFGAPQANVYAAQILLAALSLPGVVAVVRMGLRTSLAHGLIAGVAAATWYEIVYYAGRPLSEAVATTALLIALSLASPNRKLTRACLIAIGASLALVLMLRIQLTPALLVAALLIGRLSVRERWLPMAFGAVIPVLLFAAVDWLHWGNPFASTLNNVRVQLLENKASTFGVHPTRLVFYDGRDDVGTRWLAGPAGAGGAARENLVALDCGGRGHRRHPLAGSAQGIPFHLSGAGLSRHHGGDGLGGPGGTPARAARPALGFWPGGLCGCGLDRRVGAAAAVERHPPALDPGHGVAAGDVRTARHRRAVRRAVQGFSRHPRRRLRLHPPQGADLRLWHHAESRHRRRPTTPSF